MTDHKIEKVESIFRRTIVCHDNNAKDVETYYHNLGWATIYKGATKELYHSRMVFEIELEPNQSEDDPPSHSPIQS